MRLERGVELKLNLGTGQGSSVSEVIEACREVTGHPIPAVVTGPRAGDPPALVADPARPGASWAGSRDTRRSRRSSRRPGDGTRPIPTGTPTEEPARAPRRILVLVGMQLASRPFGSSADVGVLFPPREPSGRGLRLRRRRLATVRMRTPSEASPGARRGRMPSDPHVSHGGSGRDSTHHWTPDDGPLLDRGAAHRRGGVVAGPDPGAVRPGADAGDRPLAAGPVGSSGSAWAGPGSSLVCLLLVAAALLATAGLLAYQAGTMLKQSDRYLHRLGSSSPTRRWPWGAIAC